MIKSHKNKKSALTSTNIEYSKINEYQHFKKLNQQKPLL